MSCLRLSGLSPVKQGVAVIAAGLLFLLGFFIFSAAPGGDIRQARRIKAKTEIRTLKEACSLYKKNTGKWPATLEEMTRPAGTSPLLERVSLDPWNGPYDYRVLDNQPFIISFGEDGAPGGTGTDADISSDDIRKSD